MLEIGQPMHVFDKDKLNGALDVRFAKKGEKIAFIGEPLSDPLTFFPGFGIAIDSSC